MNFRVFSRILLTVPSLLCAIDSDELPSMGDLTHTWPTAENLPPGALDDFELLPTTPYPSVPEAVQPQEAPLVKAVDACTTLNKLRRCALEKCVMDKGLWSRFSHECASASTMQGPDQEKFQLYLLWELAGKPAPLAPYSESAPTPNHTFHEVRLEKFRAPRTIQLKEISVAGETKPDHTLLKNERVRESAAAARSRAKKRQQDLEDRVRKSGRWEQFSCQFEAEAKSLTEEQFIRPHEQEMLDDGSLDSSVLHALLNRRKLHAIANAKVRILTVYTAMAPPTTGEELYERELAKCQKMMLSPSEITALHQTQAGIQRRYRQKISFQQRAMQDQLVAWGIGVIKKSAGGGQTFIHKGLQDELDRASLPGPTKRTDLKRSLIKELYERERANRMEENNLPHYNVPLAEALPKASTVPHPPEGTNPLYLMQNQLAEWGIGVIKTSHTGAQTFIYKELRDELDQSGLCGREKTNLKKNLIKQRYERELTKRRHTAVAPLESAT